MTKQIPINLKFFNEDNTDTNASQQQLNQQQPNQNQNINAPQTTLENQDDKQGDPKKYGVNITKDILNSLLEDTRKSAIEEALKMSKMTEEQQKAYEQEQLIKTLEAREKDISAKELNLQALNILGEQSLDKAFVNLVVGKDFDTTKDNINTLKAVFDKAVQDRIEKRLAGKTPTMGSDNNAGGATLTNFLQTIIDNQAKRR